MRLLQQLVASPLAAALGWTLLHSLWQGALAAAALAVTRATVRSPRVRYAAACIAMLLLLAGFALTLPRMLPPAALHPRFGAVPALPASHLASSSLTHPPAGIAWNALVPWIAPFWMAGVALLYAWQLAGCLAIFRLRRRGVCAAPAHWQAASTRLAARLRVTRPVVLLESCLTEVPVVAGHFRPVILLPLGLATGLPADQVEAILLHELAHIRRYDYLVNLWQHVLEGLFFYHPAAWWISGAIRTEREHCCDDVVVTLTGDARAYAATLAALETTRCHGREPALAVTGGNLVTRIHRLLYPEVSNPKLSYSAGAPLLATAILIATAAVALAAFQPEPAPQAAAPATAPSPQPAVTPTVAPRPLPSPHAARPTPQPILIAQAAQRPPSAQEREARLRAELESPDLILLIGVNTRFGNGKNIFMPKVIDAQKEVAAALPRTRYVDTAGAETLPPSHTHFTAIGTLEIGRRYAEALLAGEQSK